MSCFNHGMEIFFMLQLSQKDLLVFFRRNGEGVLLVTDKIEEMDFLMVCRTEGSLWSLVFIRAAASLKLNKGIRRASSALRWVSTWDKRCIKCSRWWATLLALWAAHRWKRSWVSPVVFWRRNVCVVCACYLCGPECHRKCHKSHGWRPPCDPPVAHLWPWWQVSTPSLTCRVWVRAPPTHGTWLNCANTDLWSSKQKKTTQRHLAANCGDDDEDAEGHVLTGVNIYTSQQLQTHNTYSQTQKCSLFSQLSKSSVVIMFQALLTCWFGPAQRSTLHQWTLSSLLCVKAAFCWFHSAVQKNDRKNIMELDWL